MDIYHNEGLELVWAGLIHPKILGRNILGLLEKWLAQGKVKPAFAIPQLSFITEYRLIYPTKVQKPLNFKQVFILSR